MSATKTRRRARRQPSEAQKESAKQRRAELIELSRAAKEMLDAGALPEEFEDCQKVNDVLQRMHELDTGESEWNGFQGWKEKGFRIRKGEHGFAVWGKPRKFEREEAPATGEDPVTRSYKAFPIAYLFHRGQVDPSNSSNPGESPATASSNPAPSSAPAGGGASPRCNAELAEKLRGQDSEHVQRAFQHLAPGGILVAIVSEGLFFRKDAKAQAFRDLFDEHGLHEEANPEGSFLGTVTPTGTATRTIVLSR